MVVALTDNAWGRKIANTIAYHGVDTRQVVWTTEDRIGTYYYEEASEPRGNQVLYDRAGSAFSNFSFEQLPVEMFEPRASKWLHFTGISLGLGETCRGLIHRAVQLAKSAVGRLALTSTTVASYGALKKQVRLACPILN